MKIDAKTSSVVESSAKTSPVESSAKTSTISSSSCRKNVDENATFVADFVDHFKEFIHRPIDEHKACFMSKYDKMTDKLANLVSMGKKEEESATVDASAKTN